ncbi:MAG: Cupin domain protein [Lentisphaerae bacterium ADurb.BinA184]|nr:MAG: Cupin domain protein [Lentisphaerae bacterium ADurb.BinA184]
MGAAATRPYLVRHLRDAAVVACPCGVSHRIFTRADTPVANLHVTEITDSRKHFHRKSSEYYYILEGSGHMELGDDVIPVEPGTAVIIPPGTAHRAYGNLKALIVVIPAAEHGDEYFADAGQGPAQTR